MSWELTSRPEKIKDMALYPTLRKWLEMYEGTGEFNHLLFHGDTGTGKTTAAYILAGVVCDDFSIHKHVIDCSSKPNITQFREIAQRVSISQGGLTKFFSQPTKEVFIFDEFHKLPKDTQTVLNRILENDAVGTPCIFCVNDLDSVEKPIRSRTKRLPFNVAVVNEKKELKFFDYVDYSKDEWIEELRRVGREVCKSNDVEPLKEVEDTVFANDLYLTDVRTFIRALEDEYRIKDYYKK